MREISSRRCDVKGSFHKAGVKIKRICQPPQTKTNFLVPLCLLYSPNLPPLHPALSFVLSLCSFTCELFFAAVSHAGFQVLQLDLDLLVVSQCLLTLPPDRQQHREEGRVRQAQWRQEKQYQFLTGLMEIHSNRETVDSSNLTQQTPTSEDLG